MFTLYQDRFFDEDTDDLVLSQECRSTNYEATLRINDLFSLMPDELLPRYRAMMNALSAQHTAELKFAYEVGFKRGIQLAQDIETPITTTQEDGGS